MLSKENRKMAKFALVGVLNTGVDFAVFIVLVYGLGVSTIGAQTASYGCGIANSYWLNRKWTFRAAGNGSWMDVLRFVLVNAVSFAAATAVLLALEQGAGWPSAAAKIASILISMAVNYAGSRYWVFRSASRDTRTG